MRDYYKILGVEEEASEEEIRARWIELTKYYHPDLGGTEEGDERIKEINEAYEILKNESTRFHYDFERDLKRSFIKKAHRQQERRTNIRKIIIVPSGILVLFLVVGFILFRRGEVATLPKTEALYKVDKVPEKKTVPQIPPVKTDSKPREESKAPKEIKEEIMPPESKKMVSLSPRLSPSSVERESEQKKEPPRKILPESKVKPAPQVVMKSETPATKEVSKEVPREVPRQVAQEVPKEVPKEIPKQVAREIPNETPKEMARQVTQEVPKEVPKEIPKQVAKEIPKEALKEVAREVPKEVPKELPKEAPREVPREAPKEVPREVSKELPKEAPKEIPKEVRKDAAKEGPKEAPKEVARVTLHPRESLTMWTRGERVVSSRPSLLAKEEEVKQFFSNYVDRYNRKDVGGFLSFFSSKAVQNQKDGLEVIGNLYTKFIDQSEDLRYQIEGMKIEIYQHRVDVKARFRLDQKLKKDGEEKVWKGNIRWVLVKEEGRLKISSLDY